MTHSISGASGPHPPTSAGLFSLQGHLDRLYAGRSRRMAFGAVNGSEFLAWQSALRAELLRRLGLSGRRMPTILAERLQVSPRPDYLEEQYALSIGEGLVVPLYLLTPQRASPPYTPIVVFHGHEPSAQYSLGNYPDEATAQANLAIDNNYAQALAQAGYLVAVVEQRGFGDRLTDQLDEYSPFPRSCRHLAFAYQMYGRTLLGERCWDGLCAIQYLRSRPDVNPLRLGCTGHSGGGATALWLAALEPCLSAVLVSGYFSSFIGSILGCRHCECNYVPGILELAEMGDLAALIAPRPFCALNGQADEIFPARESVQQFETVRAAYALHNVPDACSLTLHPGGHAYRNDLSQQWFARWLKD